MPTNGSHPCIVFLHLPKTGGYTLRAALRYKYPARTLLLDETTEPFGGVESVPLEERRSARVVTGHLHYGVHRHIPQPCEHITLLREPVARVISMYHHALRHPKHRLHGELVRSGISLEEFARSGTDPALDNLYTRMLSGRGSGEFVADEWGGRVWRAPRLSEEALPEAKRNLDRFLVVGLTERFDESFILIRRALGWKLPMYETRNVGQVPSKGGRQPPSKTATDLIRERNQLDLELYEHARGLFSAAVDRQGSSFRREVAAFKLLNGIPNRLAQHVPTALRHPLRNALPR